MILTYFFITLLIAIIHSHLEIEIEGKHGWAKDLPTWKSRSTLFTKLLEKPLTGYHFWTIVLVVMIFHIPALFIRWSFQRELMVLGFISLYWVIEDFLWFIFNPHYRLYKFNQDHVSWHKRWLYGLPLEYYWGVGVFFVLMIASSV